MHPPGWGRGMQETESGEARWRLFDEHLGQIHHATLRPFGVVPGVLTPLYSPDSFILRLTLGPQVRLEGG